MRLALIIAAIVAGAATPVLAHPVGRVRAMAMDTNQDGAISLAEARAAREAMFDRFDTNDDGYLSAAERAVAPRRGRFLNAIEDGNGDGRLSHAELMAAPYRVFDRLDANDDDTVTAEEVAAARSRAR